jgi:hypothetical protein
MTRSLSSSPLAPFAVILLGVVALVALAALLFATCADAGPRLSVTPALLTENASVTVEGSGFAPRTEVELSIGRGGASWLLAKLTTNPDGSFSESIDVNLESPGVYTLTATAGDLVVTTEIDYRP